MEISIVLGYGGALLTGLVLGLMGGGGALLSIPVLVYLFHIPATTATGYSLFLVGITAAFGAVQNVRKQLVDYTATLYYGVPSVITVYMLRRFVIPNLPDVMFSIGNYAVDKNHFILFVLSVVMFGAAYKMITGSTADADSETSRPVSHVKLIAYAVAIGSFLGLVGAGGGFLMIPALVYFANLPMKKAVGTSLLLVSVNSFIGFLGDINANHALDWNFLLLFSAFSVVGVFTGIYLQHFLNGEKLKKSFGWFVLAVAVYMLIRETFWAAWRPFMELASFLHLCFKF